MITVKTTVDIEWFMKAPLFDQLFGRLPSIRLLEINFLYDEAIPWSQGYDPKEELWYLLTEKNLYLVEYVDDIDDDHYPVEKVGVRPLEDERDHREKIEIIIEVANEAFPVFQQIMWEYKKLGCYDLL